MITYNINAVDLRTSFRVQANIKNVDARSAMAEFLTSFPNTRIISAKPQ